MSLRINFSATSSFQTFPRVWCWNRRVGSWMVNNIIDWTTVSSNFLSDRWQDINRDAEWTISNYIMQYSPLKVDGIVSQKAIFFITTARSTSNPTINTIPDLHVVNHGKQMQDSIQSKPWPTRRGIIHFFY
jgi:Tfp pilus assembly protein PilX